MSEQEKTQEDTITESSSQLSLLIERQLARERIRLKQRHYRQKRRQRELELQQNYEQLQARFHALEINFHVVTKQSTVCPGVEKIHFLTCQILDTRIVFLQISHEGGSVVEKVLHRNNF